MSSPANAASVAEAIRDRKLRNEALKAAKKPAAKFESRSPADEERRRVRDAMRNHRATKRCAKKSNPAKPRQRRPSKRGSSAANA